MTPSTEQPVAPPPSTKPGLPLPVVILGVFFIGLFATLLVTLLQTRVPSIVYTAVGRQDATGAFVKVDNFTTKDNAFYCHVKFNDPRPDWQLRARWIAVAVPGGPPNETISERSTPMEDTSLDGGEVDLKQDRGFPKGKYRVDLFLDPPAKPHETHVAATKDFEVQ